MPTEKSRRSLIWVEKDERIMWIAMLSVMESSRLLKTSMAMASNFRAAAYGAASAMTVVLTA